MPLADFENCFNNNLPVRNNTMKKHYYELSARIRVEMLRKEMFKNVYYLR